MGKMPQTVIFDGVEAEQQLFQLLHVPQMGKSFPLNGDGFEIEEADIRQRGQRRQTGVGNRAASEIKSAHVRQPGDATQLLVSHPRQVELNAHALLAIMFFVADRSASLLDGSDAVPILRGAVNCDE